MDEDKDEIEGGLDGAFYVQATTVVDPTPWLLVVTTGVCIVVMLVLVPIAVIVTRRRKQQQRQRHILQQDQAVVEEERNTADDDDDEEEDDDNNNGIPVVVLPKEDNEDAAEVPALLYHDENEHRPITTRTSSWWTWATAVLSYDEETHKILKLGIPYTFSNVSGEIFSNLCLIAVSQYIGSTKDVAAYALVHILIELTHGVIYGPIDSCATLCSHAIGANNNYLAGQYIQLAIILYLALCFPLVIFWWYYMYDVILWLEWGDVETATLAQTYTHAYIWTTIFDGITATIWAILDITDHATEGAILDFVKGALEMILIVSLASTGNITLHEVGLIFTIMSFVSLIISLIWSYWQGWLIDFHDGVFQKFTITTNFPALQTMIKTSIPLSGSELSSNAEWAVLTVFASYVGQAEVAAWAILGSIWDLFHYLSAGFGEAAEIRTSLHLGNNHPTLAELSTHKSLVLGLVFATTVSLVFFSLKDIIPALYTPDATLQGMLRELVPFVGVANMAMSYGMDCWSVVGAQGKYDLATYITLLSTWGICMPLAALLTLVYHFNLQALMASATAGYVTTSACLSYIVLSSNWPEIALKIVAKNKADDEDESESDDDEIKAPTTAVFPIRRSHVDARLDERDSLETTRRTADEESPLLGDE